MSYSSDMKKISGLFLMTVAAFFVSGCNEKNQLEGSWVCPVPGQDNSVQGFKLEKGGKASSINMETLKYERWASPDKNHIIFSGKSIGNGQTIDFSDSFEIEEIKSNVLILKQGETRQIYEKMN